MAMASGTASVTSFDLRVLVEELQILVGGFVQKIYQPSYTSIALRVRVPGIGNRELFAEIGGLVFLSSRTVEKPQTASPFAMFLRKRLKNARIGAVAQHSFDRVLVLTLQKEKEYELVFELFRNGNVILVDKDTGIIERPLTGQSWATREVKRGRPYVPPPSTPDPLSNPVFSSEGIAANKPAVSYLASEMGFGGRLAEEILHRAGIPQDAVLGGDILSSVKRVITEVMKLRKPCVYRKEGRITAFRPFVFETEEGEIIEAPSFLSAVEAYYYQSLPVPLEVPSEEIHRLQGNVSEADPSDTELKEGKENEVKAENKVSSDIGGGSIEGSRELERLKRQLTMQTEAVKRLEEERSRWERAGETVYANWGKVEELIRVAAYYLVSERPVKVPERPRLPEGVDIVKVSKDEGVVHFSFEGMVIPIGGEGDVSRQASACYERGRKAKEKLKGAKRALEETRLRLEKYKESERREKVSERRVMERRYWFQKFRWFPTSDGYLAAAGKDAKSNEILVKKYMKAADRYAHSTVHGAPSVVIRSDVRFYPTSQGLEVKLDVKDPSGAGVPDSSAEEGAMYSALLSRAWSSQFGSAECYWVEASQVSKTPSSGEFVGTGAFIIRGKRNLLSTPMELAVGTIRLKEGVVVVSGPERAIGKHAERYVVLVPGNGKQNVTTKEVASKLRIQKEAVQPLIPRGAVVARSKDLK